MTFHEWVELFANLFIYAGAIAITFAPRWSIRPHLFLFFLIGHLIWTMAGFVFYDPWHWRIVMLNGGFVVLDLIAIYKRWGLKDKMGVSFNEQA